jgi:pyruvate/2-oxoglutarate/acetoin dehydrogenase E1 component
MRYVDEVVRALKYLNENENTLFIGQTTEYPYSKQSDMLDRAEIPKEKKLELPVFEETQMGVSIGLAMEGIIPISTYPRFDFVLLAANQLVNHLDKISEITKNQLKPKVIIRTCVGSVKPLYPGVQHCQDYSEAFKMLLKNVEVISLKEPEDIIPAYKKALEREDGRSTLLVEYADFYKEK